MDPSPSDMVVSHLFGEGEACDLGVLLFSHVLPHAEGAWARGTTPDPPKQQVVTHPQVIPSLSLSLQQFFKQLIEVQHILKV